MFNRIKTAKRLFKCNCHTASDYTASNIEWNKFMKLPHQKKLDVYFESAPHLRNARKRIPKEYLDARKKSVLPDSLYLNDSALAAKIAKLIVPEVLKRNDALICETNPGLGYLTKELLGGGVPRLRLYETCSDFRTNLRDFDRAYPGKLELFVKDIFHVWKLSHIDKHDKGNRVEEFLKGVPRKKWTDDPCLIILGTMPKLEFMNYLMKNIAFQSELITYGRVELFVVVRPGDYLKLTGGPHMDLHTYQKSSVLFNTFCKTTLLAKLPRVAFVPWDTNITIHSRTKTVRKYDIDKMYLVHIELKKLYDLKPQQCLPFYYFVKQFFGRGTVKVIPKLEQWISDIGLNIIAPDASYNLNKDIGIYTRSGELTPEEIVKVFRILHDHPGYTNSPFTAIVEAELLKFETIETDLAEVNKMKTK